MQSQKQAVIIAQPSQACHQIGELLHQHGWQLTTHHGNSGFHHLCKLQPGMFIADIDDPCCRGIALLEWFKKLNPTAITFALCRGGNTPVMRLARNRGVSGFFYFNSSGKGLDKQCGMGRLLLHQDNSSSTLNVTTLPCDCHHNHTIDLHACR